MKNILSYRRLHAGNNRKLCKPFGYSDKEEIVFTKQFVVSGYTIAIRPFCIATDLSIAYEWFRHEYAKRTWKTNGPVKQLELVYTQMMQCDFAQPLTILQDNVPVCLVEVHHANHHEISLYYEALTGDYDMFLLVSPKKKKDMGLIGHVIQTCLEYVFSFEEVERIMAEINIYNEPMNQVLNVSGFRFLNKVDMLDRI